MLANFPIKLAFHVLSLKEMAVSFTLKNILNTDFSTYFTNLLLHQSNSDLLFLNLGQFPCFIKIHYK